MPRAAAPLLVDDNADDNSARGEIDEVFTTLRVPARSAAEVRGDGVPAGERSSAPRRSSASAVATAFLTNLSGGADCFAVDMGLVASHAIDEELTQAFSDARRQMAFADSAAWSIADVAETSVVIVATATHAGDDGQVRRFTLHIDVDAATPIASIEAHALIDVPRRETWREPSEEPEPVGMGWGVRVGGQPAEFGR